MVTWFDKGSRSIHSTDSRVVIPSSSKHGFSSNSRLRQFKDFSLGSFPYIQLLTHDHSLHSQISHHDNGYIYIYIYWAHMNRKLKFILFISKQYIILIFSCAGHGLFLPSYHYLNTQVWKYNKHHHYKLNMHMYSAIKSVQSRISIQLHRVYEILIYYS